MVGHIWAVLRAAGFSGGSVLDLGCGAGGFLRHAPADLSIAYTGVEVDPISAQIARALHPEANIITGDLTKVSLPHKRFDACVGNLPFSGARVWDGAIGFHGPLHEYFVARAVTAVRHGGYVVVVTSRHELDAAGGLSASIRRHADLIAAVRLPAGYFRDAGTDVVADVLILRVRDGDGDTHGWHPSDHEARTALAGTVGPGYSREWVSGFWDRHPELVAGSMRLTGFARQPLAVDADNPAPRSRRRSPPWRRCWCPTATVTRRRPTWPISGSPMTKAVNGALCMSSTGRWSASVTELTVVPRPVPNCEP